MRLPNYLSLKSGTAIWAIAAFTYLNAIAGVGLCFTVPVVAPAEAKLVAQMKALNKTLIYPMSVDLDHSLKDVLPLVDLYFWIKFCLVIIVVRCASRKAINIDIRTRKLGVTNMSHTEYHMDLIVFSGFMVLGVWGLWVSLRNGATKSMIENGASPSRAHLVEKLVWLFVNTWLGDIAFRFAWIGISQLLEQDFLTSAGYRFVQVLPRTEPAGECPICLVEDEMEFCVLPCGHIFHRHCMQDWMRFCFDTTAPCPMCRTSTMTGDEMDLGYD